MVDPQLMQDRGIEIVHMHGILDDVVTEVIGLAISHPTSNASTRHPGRKTSRMMISTVLIPLDFSLSKGGTSEFSPKDHQGLIEQST